MIFRLPETSNRKKISMKKQIFAVLIASALLAACGQQRESVPAQQMSAHSAAPTSADAQTVAVSASSVAAYAVEVSTVAASNVNPPTQITTHSQPTYRPFVITAELTFRTDDVRKTSVAIEQLATQQGGFVVSNQTSSHIIASETFKQTDGTLLNIERYTSVADLIVRVPREKAQIFLHALQPHISLLEQQNYAAQDIFANMQREILTMQREQDKAKALQQLNQQATPRTADHSDRERTIENQFATREREDEAKIQQAELRDKVDYATITLRFRQPESVMKYTVADSKTLAAQQRPPVWASVQQAFAFSMQILFELLLLILQTWFVWLGLSAAWLLWRKSQKKSSSKDKS